MLSRSRKMGQDEDPKLDQTSSSKGSKSQPKSSGKSVQAEEPVFEIACIICYKIKRHRRHGSDVMESNKGVYHSREDKRTQGSRKAPSQEFNLHDMKFAASPGPKETL
ncbi:hypothetical protein Tco_0652045 [Tanacetum coccineum]|uniref:Uncharacterized protein n=1 Tax=Tanacetum coccineum TaxID=301880 RepID=A0ABQ4WWG0_9ASTR